MFTFPEGPFAQASAQNPCRPQPPVVCQTARNLLSNTLHSGMLCVKRFHHLNKNHKIILLVIIRTLLKNRRRKSGQAGQQTKKACKIQQLVIILECKYFGQKG